MGFNPRLAPFTVSRHFRLHFETAQDTNDLHRPLFKFPFAGQIIAAYANAERYIAGGLNTAVEATTNTGIDEMSIWKHATDDTTATYATGLRSLQRTGAQDSSTGGGINWRLPGTSGEDSMYSFSNNNTASAARKQYAAGDVAMLYVRNYGATDTSRIFHINVQMDYVIGHEAGSAPTAGTGPA
jgi:hypothetical protein